MRTIAYALNVVSTVLCSLFVIPLIWMIPMTIASKKAINDGQFSFSYIYYVIFLPFWYYFGNFTYNTRK